MISTQAPEYLNKNAFIVTASRGLEELFPLIYSVLCESL